MLLRVFREIFKDRPISGLHYLDLSPTPFVKSKIQFMTSDYVFFKRRGTPLRIIQMLKFSMKHFWNTSVIRELSEIQNSRTWTSSAIIDSIRITLCISKARVPTNELQKFSNGNFIKLFNSEKAEERRSILGEGTETDQTRNSNWPTRKHFGAYWRSLTNTKRKKNRMSNW